MDSSRAAVLASEIAFQSFDFTASSNFDVMIFCAAGIVLSKTDYSNHAGVLVLFLRLSMWHDLMTISNSGTRLLPAIAVCRLNRSKPAIAAMFPLHSYLIVAFKVVQRIASSIEGR